MSCGLRIPLASADAADAGMKIMRLAPGAPCPARRDGAARHLFGTQRQFLRGLIDQSTNTRIRRRGVLTLSL